MGYLNTLRNNLINSRGGPKEILEISPSSSQLTNPENRISGTELALYAIGLTVMFLGVPHVLNYELLSQHPNWAEGLQGWSMEATGSFLMFINFAARHLRGR